MTKSKKQDELEYIEDGSSSEALAKEGKLRKKLKSCEKERAEYLAGWQRAKADLINYKKEQEEKNSELFKFANEITIMEILPVLDSFELALKHNNPKSPESIGLSQIYNQLKSILKNQGLEEIESMGKKFDPEFHEAVAEGHPVRKRGVGEGIIVEEIQKGYMLNGKVIRPSKVKISK